MTNSFAPEIWLMYPEIKISQKPGNLRLLDFSSLLVKLHGFRRKVVSNFASLLPEPQTSLLSGVFLGVRSRMPEDFVQALRRTGTLHVVVASGYNVAVVAGVLVAGLVKIVSRRWAVPFVLIGIFVYTIMAGAEPPIVRAAIMGSMLIVAQFFGKQYHGFWALLITATLMALVWPLIVFDVGFQLSFAATFGILALSPLIMQNLRRVFGFFGRGLVEELAVTLGAQFAVLPIL